MLGFQTKHPGASDRCVPDEGGIFEIVGCRPFLANRDMRILADALWAYKEKWSSAYELIDHLCLSSAIFAHFIAELAFREEEDNEIPF